MTITFFGEPGRSRSLRLEAEASSEDAESGSRGGSRLFQEVSAFHSLPHGYSEMVRSAYQPIR